jgi:hypothetical protein
MILLIFSERTGAGFIERVFRMKFSADANYGSGILKR